LAPKTTLNTADVITAAKRTAARTSIKVEPLLGVTESRFPPLSFAFLRFLFLSVPFIYFSFFIAAEAAYWN
jgi:hypothetical protein